MLSPIISEKYANVRKNKSEAPVPIVAPTRAFALKSLNNFQSNKQKRKVIKPQNKPIPTE